MNIKLTKKEIAFYGILIPAFFGLVQWYYSYRTEKREGSKLKVGYPSDISSKQSTGKGEAIYIKNLIKSTEDAVNTDSIGDFMNVINNDTAINTSIQIISNNGKGLDLNFQTDVNLKHPYFNAKIHRYEIGEYSISNSSVQKAIINCFQSFYTNYRKTFDVSGSNIVIDICGNADGVKVFPGSTYQGDLGDQLSIPYFSVNENCSKKVTFIKNNTLLTNEHFALLRGYVIKSGIEDNFEDLKGKIELRTRTYNEIGPDFRSVNIRLKIHSKAVNEYLN